MQRQSEESHTEYIRVAFFKFVVPFVVKPERASHNAHNLTKPIGRHDPVAKSSGNRSDMAELGNR